jgi:hypothetical protein
MVNLQLTAVERCMDVSIHARIDDAMRLVMQELQIPVPEPATFQLTRFVRIEQRLQHEIEIRVGGVTDLQPNAETVAMIKKVELVRMLLGGRESVIVQKRMH